MPIKYMPPIAGSIEWGDIAGSIASQGDLNNLLDDKSPINHNHSLYELIEKSYNSLDDLPNLDNYLKRSELLALSPCYTFDGIDDYLSIRSSIFLDVSANFSMILYAKIDEYEEHFAIATKLDSTSKSGWKLHCNYGVPKFTFADGTNIVSVNHTQTLDEGKMYKFTISYDDSNKKLIFGIDDNFEEYNFPSLSLPMLSAKEILIAKNDELNLFSKLSLHSFVFFNKSLSINELNLVARNGEYNKEILVKNRIYTQIMLIPYSFGDSYWYDSSGRNRNAEVKGGSKAFWDCEKLIIPLIGLDSSSTFSNLIPANYTLENILIQNFSNDDCDVSLYLDSDLIINNETISDNNEKGFSINRMADTYVNSDLEFVLSGVNIDLEVHLFLRKQLGLLWSI